MPLSYEEASPLIGQSVSVHTSQGLVDLLLIQALELPRRGLPEQFRTPLSLVFTADDTVALGQDNYTVEHALFGQRQWMIVPILPSLEATAQQSALNPQTSKMRYYQVIFN